ncbi:MAG: tetratricopeptide repeat protein [Candidatus Omnitrophica bacterium]|nr:tetratricopeptide repeat protein [Candidatus Omnitrophota bacterium]
MFFKKYLLFVLLVSGFCNFLYAGELVSTEAPNYYKEGVKFQKAGRFNDADIAYQKVLLVDPYNSNWKKYIFNNYGIMYAKQGDLKKAEAAFNEALNIDPHYQTAQINLAFVYEKTRSKLESIEYWLKALNINLDEMKPKDFVVQEINEDEAGTITENK